MRGSHQQYPLLKRIQCLNYHSGLKLLIVQKLHAPHPVVQHLTHPREALRLIFVKEPWCRNVLPWIIIHLSKRSSPSSQPRALSLEMKSPKIELQIMFFFSNSPKAFFFLVHSQMLSQLPMPWACVIPDLVSRHLAGPPLAAWSCKNH